mmetsp:Transcript_7886/g.17042  ORF Transcript_7886/g.17042 Transcript_7886/m.17042 type:complete len:82 (+) Transcript_7886:48-293(+)
MAEGDGSMNFLCSCLCSFFLPPVGVYWRFGCGFHLLMCTILTVLGYLPGVVYAMVLLVCVDTGSEDEVGPLVGVKKDGEKV